MFIGVERGPPTCDKRIGLVGGEGRSNFSLGQECFSPLPQAAVELECIRSQGGGGFQLHLCHAQDGFPSTCLGCPPPSILVVQNTLTASGICAPGAKAALSRGNCFCCPLPMLLPAPDIQLWVLGALCLQKQSTPEHVQGSVPATPKEPQGSHRRTREGCGKDV